MRRCYWVEESKNHTVELIRPLQRREMAHIRQIDQFGIGNTTRQILGMFWFDKLIMLGLHNDHRNPNRRQIFCRIVGLRSLHQAYRVGKRLLALLAWFRACPHDLIPEQFKLWGMPENKA